MQSGIAGSLAAAYFTWSAYRSDALFALIPPMETAHGQKLKVVQEAPPKDNPLDNRWQQPQQQQQQHSLPKCFM